ncbi:unnamed protein product, partial [Didymodactylos carnosus]
NDYTDQKRSIDELELEGIVDEDPDFFRTPNIRLFSSSKTQEIRPRFEPIRISDAELMKNVALPSILNRESCFLYINPSDPRNAPYHPLPVILSLVKLSKKVIKMVYYLMTDESTIAVIYNYLKKGSDIELQLVINETVYERKEPVHDLCELPNVKLTVLRGRDEHGIMHNKILIVDDVFMVSGSNNLTHYAKYHNFESCIYTRDQTLLKSVVDYFKNLFLEKKLWVVRDHKKVE